MLAIIIQLVQSRSLVHVLLSALCFFLFFGGFNRSIVRNINTQLSYFCYYLLEFSCLKKLYEVYFLCLVIGHGLYRFMDFYRFAALLFLYFKVLCQLIVVIEEFVFALHLYPEKWQFFGLFVPGRQVIVKYHSTALY